MRRLPRNWRRASRRAEAEAERLCLEQSRIDLDKSVVRFKTMDVDLVCPDAAIGRGRRRPPDLHAENLSFAARLVLAVGRYCEGRAALAYKRAGLSRQVYSRLAQWDDSQPDKMTVMRFCIGLQLPMHEAEELMLSAGYAFSLAIPADVVFAHCIGKGIWSILDVNELLVRNGLPDMSIEI